MATFIGFNTINQNKKFTLVDFDLIKRDLLNSFNIRQGELVGRPGYGTNLWDYIFENQLPDTEAAIVQEIQRLVSNDPRIIISDIQIFPQDNGILIELELTVVPSSTAERLAIFFDELNRQAAYV